MNEVWQELRQRPTLLMNRAFIVDGGSLVKPPPSLNSKPLIEEMSHGTNLSRHGTKLKETPRPSTVRIFNAPHEGGVGTPYPVGGAEQFGPHKTTI